VRQDILDALGVANLGITRRRLRLPPARTDRRRGAARHGIPVAAVSTGFPAGLSPFRSAGGDPRVGGAGAREIDVVITRAHVLNGEWEALYDEVRAFREACGDAHIKVILGTGELSTLRNIARASWWR
jgi:deoxyribose-phosphate aldolase